MLSGSVKYLLSVRIMSFITGDPVWTKMALPGNEFMMGLLEVSNELSLPKAGRLFSVRTL